MKIEGKDYKTIWFDKNIVKIIDQTKLPHKFLIKELKLFLMTRLSLMYQWLTQLQMV